MDDERLLEPTRESRDDLAATERDAVLVNDAQAGPQSSTATAEEAMPIKVSLLDRLVDLAGELVLSRNQLQAAILQSNRRLLNSAGQRLNQVTSDMQDAITRTRLQPIENVFSKLPAVVRDLSDALKKEVSLELGGEEVLLDRSLVKSLSDPLTYLVRNAIDHGIEMPDLRASNGKPRAGTLRVDARHEGGHVLVEITDDGKGIDYQRVAQTALASGLITSEQLKGMTIEDQVALILLPGISTTDEVTSCGVGLDAVKNILDRLGGQMEVSSKTGQGTTFRIKLPLSPAIVPALIVSVAKGRFAIPQINVEELLRIRGEERQRRIEVVGGTEVLVLRDCMLPLLRLEDHLDLRIEYEDAEGNWKQDRRTRLADRRSARYAIDEPGPTEKNQQMASDIQRTRGRRHSAASALEIAVVNTGNLRYGMVVMSFDRTEELMMKPKPVRWKDCSEYAGVATLCDGAEALVLDAGGLARKAGLASIAASPRACEQARKASDYSGRLTKLQSPLMFRDGPGQRYAIPVDAVQRIDRIDASQVVSTDGRRTMQVGNQDLPLVALSEAGTSRTGELAGELAVIVCTVFNREIGLLVNMPLKVDEDSEFASGSTSARRPAVPGSQVARDQTTFSVNLAEITDTAYPEWRSAAIGHHNAAISGPKT